MLTYSDKGCLFYFTKHIFGILIPCVFIECFEFLNALSRYNANMVTRLVYKYSD